MSSETKQRPGLIAAAPDLLSACKAANLMREDGAEAVCIEYKLEWEKRPEWELDGEREAAMESAAEEFIDNLTYDAIAKAEAK